MNKDIIKKENIKITLIEDETEYYTRRDENCYFEIKIRKSALSKLHRIAEVEITENCSMTRREKEILRYLALGLNNEQISSEMNISIHTAKAHVHRVFEKLDVQGRTEAVVKAIKYNLIKV